MTLKNINNLDEISKINDEDFLKIDIDNSTINAYDLYKWLRVSNKNNHCIFVSHHPLSYYLQYFPNESILFLGQGVSFYEKPFDESGIDENKLSKFNEDSFTLLLTKSLNLKKIRHELANKTALIWYNIYLDSIVSKINLTSLKNTIDSNLDLSVLHYLNPFKTNDLSENEKKFLNTKLNDYKDLNVLCIDDISDWADFYRKIIKNVTHLDSTNWNDINYEIISVRPNCIFLDLRLLNEKDEIKPENLSGVKILNNLVKEYPEIPVVITSASDDSETIEYVKSNGAFDFWQKKGIDSTFSSVFIKKEFIRFFEIVDRLKEIKSSIAKKEIYKYHQLKRFKSQKEIAFFKKYDLILIDTNFWMDNKQFADILFKIDTLCRNRITNASSQLNFDFDKKTYHCINPDKHKVVITNDCLSELIKHSKFIFNPDVKDKETSLRTSFALDVIKELISENLLVISNYDDSTYDYKAYADPKILDYIMENILGTSSFTTNDKGVLINKKYFRNNDGSINSLKYSKYKITKTNAISNDTSNLIKTEKIAVLTNDGGLSTKIQLINNKNIEIVNSDKFIKTT